MKHLNRSAKGFTLIELLVVIAIVAILAVVVILTLNPAELLRQARDSTRASDLATMKSVLALYQTDVAQSPSGTGSWCFVTTSSVSGAGCGGVFSASYYTPTSTGAGSRAINGTGWIPVDLTKISSNSPISNLPVDPVNNATYFYAYAATTTNNGGYKIAASRMESTKYSNGGGGDIVSGDGGPNVNAYEIGSNLSL